MKPSNAVRIKLASYARIPRLGVAIHDQTSLEIRWEQLYSCSISSRLISNEIDYDLWASAQHPLAIRTISLWVGSSAFVRVSNIEFGIRRL
jgi:hypothetical protein